LRIFVLLVVFVLGSGCLQLEAPKPGTGADEPAQDVAARRKTAEGTDERIEAIRIHDALLPGRPRRC
jgi:hypothetical protein